MERVQRQKSRETAQNRSLADEQAQGDSVVHARARKARRRAYRASARAAEFLSEMESEIGS